MQFPTTSDLKGIIYYSRTLPFSSFWGHTVSLLIHREYITFVLHMPQLGYRKYNELINRATRKMTHGYGVSFNKSCFTHFDWAESHVSEDSLDNTFSKLGFQKRKS